MLKFSPLVIAAAAAFSPANVDAFAGLPRSSPALRALVSFVLV